MNDSDKILYAELAELEVDSPNSLLIGFMPSYHTLIVNSILNARQLKVLPSSLRDHDVLASWLSRNRKGEKSQYTPFLFCSRTQRREISTSICTQIQCWSPLRTRVCCCHRKVLSTRQKLFFLTSKLMRRIPVLDLICKVSTVFSTRQGPSFCSPRAFSLSLEAHAPLSVLFATSVSCC